MIVIVVIAAHCPGLGVNVYVVVAVLFNAGAHVPGIPLLLVVGNGFNIPPLHIGATCVNVGVTGDEVLTVTLTGVLVQFLASFTMTT